MLTPMLDLQDLYGADLPRIAADAPATALLSPALVSLPGPSGQTRAIAWYPPRVPPDHVRWTSAFKRLSRALGDVGFRQVTADPKDPATCDIQAAIVLGQIVALFGDWWGERPPPITGERPPPITARLMAPADIRQLLEGRNVALALNPHPGNSWFKPSTLAIEIGLDPMSLSSFVHEFVHLVDHLLYLKGKRHGDGDVFGGDVYASWIGLREKNDSGPFAAVMGPAREAARAQVGTLLPSLIRNTTRGWPAALDGVRDRVLAGETVPIAEALDRLGIPAAQQDELISALSGFFLMDRTPIDRICAAAGVDPAAVLALKRWLPQGTPFSLLEPGKERERVAYARGLVASHVERQLREYYLAPHEVFARLIDQAVRERAVAAGTWVGLGKRLGDLPAADLAALRPKLDPAFAGVGIRTRLS